MAADRYPLPRSHPGRAVKRWPRELPVLPDARGRIAAFAARNPRWKPMLELYDRLVRHAGVELFGSGIMGGGLVLASRPDVEHDEGVIIIEFDPSRERFSLCYRHRDVEEGQTELCSPAEIWERLRLFLGYKFGIRIAKVPNA